MKNFIQLLILYLFLFIPNNVATAQQKSAQYSTLGKHIKEYKIPSGVGEDEEEEADEDQGVYRIELTFTGNLAVFSPTLVVSGYIDSTACPKGLISNPQSMISQEEHESLYDNINEIMFNEVPPLHNFLIYEKSPKVFSSPLIFTSLPKSHGMDVYMYSTPKNTAIKNESSKIKVTMKGFFRDKLMKTDTIEVTSIYAEDADYSLPRPFSFSVRDLDAGMNSMLDIVDYCAKQSGEIMTKRMDEIINRNKRSHK